jgi:hypothetical protein
MADLLPAQGVIEYNGVNMSGPKTRTLSFRARPQYDPAGRTVVFVVYTIRIEFYLQGFAPAGTTDQALELAKPALLAPGGPLFYANKGVGGTESFAINVAGVRDVMWGPKPTDFVWDPVGGAQSCRCEWEVEVALPYCSPAALHTFGFLEFNYRLDFSRNAAGYERLTYTGYYTIPQTRLQATARTLTDHADDDRYLSAVMPLPPSQFRRESVRRSLDESKCRMDFTVEDVQLPVPLQPFAVECDAEHTVQSQKGFVQWNGTISATYLITPDQPRDMAWTLFFELVRDRLAYVKQFGEPTQIPLARPVAIPIAFSAREMDIFGEPRSAFSLTYHFTTSARTFLQASGLWQPVASGNDDLWRLSMAGTMFGLRGNAGLRFKPNADAIIDLCASQAASLEPAQAQLQTRPFPGMKPELRTEKPQPQNSWMKYDCSMRVDQEDNVVEHKPMEDRELRRQPQDPDEIIDPGQGQQPPIRRLENNQGGKRIENYQTGIDTGVHQTVSVPSIFITLEGVAVRAGYLIEPPVLRQAAGVELEPANRPDVEFFDSWIAANYGVPVVCARWRQRWRFTKVPAESIGVPVNPIPG